MRWKYKSWDEEEWRRWFAWYPIIVENYRVWLETVEKAYFFSRDGFKVWLYRFLREAKI